MGFFAWIGANKIAVAFVVAAGILTIGMARLDNHTVAWANNSILCHITQ